MESSTELRAEDECPICHNPLPRGIDASEAHVATCIENQLFHIEENKSKSGLMPSKGAQLFGAQVDNDDASMSTSNALTAPPNASEEDRCPICSALLSSKAIGDNQSAREAHVMACLDAQEWRQSGSVSMSNNIPQSYSDPPSTKGAMAPPTNSTGFFAKAAAPLPPPLESKKESGNSNSKNPLPPPEIHSTDVHIRQKRWL